ncbi:aminotransferase class III-fold pyridoxal phosphate-dependent enzyme [Actinomadura syzygii]|uniref:Aminotransferase class III-fold pyridoxal phosphate-dependent enzyme n=1 Tax=Actinomadura syzygii TaxID=1427538 RepID=A0A5D0UD49_9ACTN|nr:aminotransferase class III-fold pyridoxal phosphate-dependent enzyme [Actinomadura syzygii]TYC15029.1 aminotransferase class III-fold pyridoxal phosphate-dependent enzyme [Actinomadura syzygii]
MRSAGLAVVEAGRVLWWTVVLAVRFGLGRRDRVRAARLLRAYLLRMGPLYIKAGQVLGTQSGLLPRDAVEEFRTFFAELPPMRDRVLRRTLRRGLGRSPDEVFAAFDMRPVAAGSVAQVHRARLDNGETVAVKVVRAGVRGRLEASSTVLGALLSIVNVLPKVRGYDLPGHFRELRPLLTGQCDMAGEGARQQEVAANFRNHPFVRVPRVHEELSSRDVLVMDFVEGASGHLPDEAGLPPHELAARMQDAFYCMVYFHGVFHVDPHPGNLVFAPGGLLVFLDFGLVGRLSEDDRWNLASFYYACIRKEWTTAVRRFTRAFAVRPERLTGSAYEEELGRILRRHFEEETSRWSTLAFLDDAIRILGRHGSRITTAFSVLALSLLTGEGFIAKVDPDIDLWATTRRFTDRFAPYLNDELRDRLQHQMADTAPRSLALRKRAARRLVAPTHFDRFVLPSAFPLVVDRAYGSKLRDVDGNEYIDLGGGFGPHILGYAHPAVVAAIQDAAARGAVNAVGHPGEVRLAELIAEAFGPDHRVLLANSGTEAVQVALRIARAFTGRQRVAKFEGHYHGFSDQGLVSSWFRYRGDPRAPEPVGNSAGMQDAVVAETLVLQYGERGSLDRIAAHADELACVIVEPMPSALADYDAEFLRALSDVCGKAGILVVYDEVVTGFRVAYGGVQHIVGTVPDLTCLGKIIGGGLPAGAVTGRADVVDTARTSGDPFHDVDGRAFAGGTMSGNSVTCAAGTAVLEQLRAWPDTYPGLRERTSWLVADLAARAADCGVPCQVRGRDSIFSITFDHATPSLVRDRLAGLDVTATLALAYHMRGHGVFLPELHTLLLSAAHSDADLEQVSEAFGKSVREMASAGFFSISRERLTGERL